jgi:hypothetical protein
VNGLDAVTLPVEISPLFSTLEQAKAEYPPLFWRVKEVQPEGAVKLAPETNKIAKSPEAEPAGKLIVLGFADVVELMLLPRTVGPGALRTAVLMTPALGPT